MFPPFPIACVYVALFVAAFASGYLFGYDRGGRRLATERERHKRY